MKTRHKKYITDNINKKSISEIARDLGVKERNIRKFLDEQKEKREKITKSPPIKRERAKSSVTIMTPIVLLIIVLAGFAVYANSLNGEFVWDDEPLVRDNLYIRGWGYLSQILTKDIGAAVGISYNFYRPVQMFTYIIDYSIGKMNVRYYHFTNIILHILVGMSIYWLVAVLYGDIFISFLASILFTVHPIHTEAIAYISGRSDPLAALFILLSFVFYVKNLREAHKTAFILAICAYALALLSRESSLIFPILLLWYHYYYKEKIGIVAYGSLVGVSAVYLITRYMLFRSSPLEAVDFPPLLTRIPGFFAAITEYTKIFFAPFHLHMEYGKKIFSITNSAALIGVTIISFILIYIFVRRKSGAITVFGLSWFLIMLAPVSNIIYPLNAYMAEHWLYMPSIGIFLALAAVLRRIYRIKALKIPVAVFLIFIIGFYSYRTVQQNGYWKNPIVLYEHILLYNPFSSKVTNNLGKIYKEMGKTDKAIALYKRAMEVAPDNPDPYNNLANIYLQIFRKPKDAIPLYKKSIELDPASANAYNNLATAYTEIGKNEEAIPLYKKAVEINPNFAGMHCNLGETYAAVGRYEDAIVSYENAVSIDSNIGSAYYALARLYYQKKEYGSAVKNCDKAVAHGVRVDSNLLESLKPYRK